MLNLLEKIASDVYLDIKVATDFPEQVPEHKKAKWYDLLWFLIPIVGIMMFTLAIENRK